jgi:hypothetical protein
MDRRRGGTAAATFAAVLVPVQGEAITPHQDARLRRDGRRGGEPPPVGRRRRPFCSTGQRAVRRRATRDPRAASVARPSLPHFGPPAHAAVAAGSSRLSRRS